MIVNTSNNKMVKYSIEKYNYQYKGKCIYIAYKRSDGARMGQVYFPLSIVKITEHNNGNIDIEIPQWIYDKKLSTGYSLIGIKRS